MNLFVKNCPKLPKPTTPIFKATRLRRLSFSLDSESKGCAASIAQTRSRLRFQLLRRIKLLASKQSALNDLNNLLDVTFVESSHLSAVIGCMEAVYCEERQILTVSLPMRSF
mmetsp:Transcript_7506/g.30152  ORF Transcript_7506/g.30152 Transcript_7506/m.30152 type:complete len:112 (+) Transcript_7506:1694-2029(+)